ncbi:MAG: tetratricopeptide repeat protein [Bacteroidota bacterium]
MRKHISLSLILLIHISAFGQDDLTPRVVANQVSIEYGMHPDIVLEMVKVFEADGVSLPKTKKTLETLISKYDHLKPESKELTQADQQELGVSDKIFNWFKFDFFTSVETKGKLSPVVYSPGGDVRIWYGIGEKAVRGLWRVFKAKEGEIYAQASAIQALQNRSNSWQKKFEKQLKTFKELEKELASRERYDEVAKRAKERLDEGDIDGAEKILEEDVLRYNKKAAYRNFEVGKVKELNLKFREATKYFRWAAELDKDNTLYSLYYGNNLIDTANYDQAIVYFKKSLKSLSNIDSSEFATRYNRLGRAYNLKGEYDRAITYYQSALAIDTTALGKNHPSVARDYNSLGSAYYYKGDYDRTITFYQSALSIDTIALGKNHPEVATCYNNLGIAYAYKGDYDRAITFYQSALSIDTTALGKNHPRVARDYHNLGSAHYKKGEYDRAITYFQLALAIDTIALGKNHPRVATHYNKLGGAYDSKGNYDRAIIYFQSALSIDTIALGKNHPSVARDYNSLGSAYNEKGEYDRAITYLQSALAIDTTALGKNHPSVATCYNNLGIAYDSKGEYDRAITYFQSALSIDTTALGKNHPRVATCYNNLGSAYKSKGEYDRAITYYQLALSVDTTALRKNHPSVATHYHNLGSAYKSKGEYDRAITYYLLSLSIDTTALGKNHPLVATFYSNLGTAYAKKGNYDRAITYYQSALSIFKAFFAPNHPNIFRLKQSLGKSFNGYGMAFYRASLFVKANRQFLLAYQLSAEIGDSSFLVISAKNLGASFKHLGKPDSGLVYLEAGIEIAKTLDEKMYEEVEALADSIRQPPDFPASVVRQYTDEAILQRLEFHQAACLKRLKKKKEAKKIFNRLLIQAKKEKNQDFIKEIKAEMK